MSAVFKKRHLANYQIIKQPGTYKVKVSATVKQGYLQDEGDKARYLVNLRAGTEESLSECLGILGSREICDFKEVRHYFMVGALWETDLDDLSKLPLKGEEVIVTFDYVEGVLRATAVTLIPRKELDYFDLNSKCESRSLLAKLINE